MKKFIGVLLLVLSLFVCACGGGNNDQPSLSIEEQIMNVLSQYGISYAEGESKDSIKSDIILPSISSDVVSISIESSNQAVISNEGKVTRPEKDTNVTLTIKGTIGDTTLEKKVDVNVLAKEKTQEEINQEKLDKIKAFLNAITISFADGETIYTVKSDIVLNVGKDKDIKTVVAISNDKIIDNNGKVTQQEEDTKVTITITASIDDVKADKKFEITVLAKEVEITDGTTIAEIQAMKDVVDAKVYNALVLTTYYDGLIVNDGTGSMLIYFGAEEHNYRAGDILTIEGKTSQYHNVWQMSATDVVITKTSTTSVNEQVATEMDATAIEAFVKATPKTVGQYIKVTGKLAVTPTKLSLMFEGISNLVVIKGYDQSWDLANKAKYTICIEAYIISFDYEGTNLEVHAINLVSATPEEEDKEPDGDKIDFVTTFATYGKDWNNQYKAREFTATDLGFAGNKDVKVNISNCSKQDTINNMPVLASKNTDQYVTITGSLKDYTGVTFYLEQWGTKTLDSIKIQYTTDGTTWVDCSDAITTPGKLVSSAFANAVGVRLVFNGGNSKNVQMGIAKIIFTK